jgi:hypothetical protein
VRFPTPAAVAKGNGLVKTCPVASLSESEDEVLADGGLHNNTANKVRATLTLCAPRHRDGQSPEGDKVRAFRQPDGFRPERLCEASLENRFNMNSAGATRLWLN